MHNDYEHKRPLFDALDQGLCSVEADIFLVDGQLLVGHVRRLLKPERTLESLYLIPLKERIAKNGGRVYRGGPEFTLLIDIKTNGPTTYAALKKVLEKYADFINSPTAVPDRGRPSTWWPREIGRRPSLPLTRHALWASTAR